jgi:hypothetical protein
MRGRGFRAASVREDPRASAWVASLDPGRKQDRMLKNAYQRTVDALKANFLHGEIVPIPPDHRFDGMTNLRCEDLAGFWRLLYTVISTQEGIHVLILDVVPHREYDRLFGVRRK